MSSDPDNLVESAPASRVERFQNRLYHDLMTPEEVINVRSDVRRFSDLCVAPISWQIGHRPEARENFPFALFREMAEAGLFRIPFEARLGGRGLKFPASATAVMLEELAYHSNSVAAIVDVHCILAGHALRHASDDIRRRYLEPMLSGKKIGSFATTEPEASTDLSVRAMQTRLTEMADRLILNGQKRFITNAPVADFVVVLCVDDGRMTEVVVDLDSPGVKVGSPDRKMGNHGQLTADICFEGVQINPANIVGERGAGLRIALQTLTYGRIGIAATGVGMAQAVFDVCVDRLKSRHVFGRPLAQSQHWQFRLADRATEIENARNLYLKAARRLDEGVAFPEPEAAMAKWYATNLAAEIAREGVQIFGGYGFMSELAADGSNYRVEEIYRDCKIAEIYEGANEIQKLVIAREIFGKGMTG